MRPVNTTYGAFPLSGEIQIMEARGNTPAYPAQGSNFVRSTLRYGPLATLVHRVYGWYSVKQTSFDAGFHTFGVEWDDTFMRFYTDSKTHAMINLRTRNAKESFWGKAECVPRRSCVHSRWLTFFLLHFSFPETAQNGSTQAVLTNIYQNGTFAAPFDQRASPPCPPSVPPLTPPRSILPRHRPRRRRDERLVPRWRRRQDVVRRLGQCVPPFPKSPSVY